MSNCTHFRHLSSEQLLHLDIFVTHNHYVPIEKIFPLIIFGWDPYAGQLRDQVKVTWFCKIVTRNVQHPRGASLSTIFVNFKPEESGLSRNLTFWCCLENVKKLEKKFSMKHKEERERKWQVSRWIRLLKTLSREKCRICS